MTTTPTSRTRSRKAAQVAELDASTPRWPEIALMLTDPASITVSGVTTTLTGDDPQREAVLLAARHASSNGRPIRMRVTTAGRVQRVIVTADHRVVPLDTGPARTGKPPAAATAAPLKTPKAPSRPRREFRRVVDRFPRPVRWAGLALAVLTAAALVVIVVHGRTAVAADTEPVPAPVPPSGELSTELPPPGWSTRAGWVLPIAPSAVPVTDPASGVTAVITAEDRSTGQAAAQTVDPRDRWLSVLEPDGRTRYAVPLDDPPRFGPVITKVDGTTVALLATADQVRYWPLTGGPGTDIDLPTGAHPTATAGGASVLLTLPGDRVGYLHAGTVRVVPLLPRTDPGIALDGTVVLTQPDTGAWWTVRADAAPTSIRPAPPPGAAAVQNVLRVTATRVILAWTPAVPDPKTPTVIVAGYDRATGQLLAATTAPAAAAPHPTTGGVVGDDAAGVTAAGPIVLTTPTTGPATLTVVPGFTATAVADRVYGTVTGGKPAVAAADGTAIVLPDGTLTPTGTGGPFLPVVSQDRLYALQPAAGT